MTEVPIMVMPWHRPDPCKPPKMQIDAAFKSSYLEYMGSLNLDSPPQPATMSGIMCTIGSASNDLKTLTELMLSGMTMALVPLAMGQRQDHKDTIANIRTANTAYNQTKNIVLPVAIAVQTKGPGLRIGGLYKDTPVQLETKAKVTLTTEKSWRLRGTDQFLYVNFPEMGHVLTESDVLLIGDGVVILQVESLDNTEAVCQVVEGGVLTSFMTLCVPDVPLHLPPLSEEDKDDLKVAASLGVDIVIATRTQCFDHIREVRRILGEEEKGSGIKVWAQIESKEALNNIDTIIKEADAVLLSRVSLTQDMPPEKLFLAQKKIVSGCNQAGVPVYLSSHYLPSMQVDITPSITEVFDVANAILDGADGFVLRNTTAIGKNPDKTVKELVKLCREAEAAVWQSQTFSFLNNHLPPPIDPTHAVAISAVEASLKSAATAILLATTSGRSAQLVARYRPRCPIIAITRYGQVARQLNTWRAVIPLHYIDAPLPEWTKEVDVRIQFGIEYGKERGIIVPGDVLVLMNGWRQGAGFTNTLRLVFASESFPWVYPHRLSRGNPADVESAKSKSTLSADAVSKLNTQLSDPRDEAMTKDSSKMSIRTLHSRQQSINQSSDSKTENSFRRLSSTEESFQTNKAIKGSLNVDTISSFLTDTQSTNSKTNQSIKLMSVIERSITKSISEASKHSQSEMTSIINSRSSMQKSDDSKRKSTYKQNNEAETSQNTEVESGDVQNTEVEFAQNAEEI